MQSFIGGANFQNKIIPWSFLNFIFLFGLNKLSDGLIVCNKNKTTFHLVWKEGTHWLHHAGTHTGFVLGTLAVCIPAQRNSWVPS